MKRFSWLIVIGILCAGASVLPAQTSSDKEDTLGWYIVRPGDTLEGITVQFLGEKSLWRENWALNPSIRDPNRLKIGQRLRIILKRKLPPRTAQIVRIGGRVDQQPSPNPWIPASQGNLLKEEDGVRTHENSSTQLEFDDRTRLTINETSLVFLREVRRTLGGVDREQIEVVEGQADISMQPRNADSSDVEIILGEVTAAPRPGRTGRAISRIRKPGDGSSKGAQVMVYGGKTRVKAAGNAVEVPEGSGTSVSEDGVVGKPEKLLPAARLSLPQRTEQLPYANPLFQWEPVAGAVNYTFEVCRNSDCSELLLRKTGLDHPEFRPEELPRGLLFWRVTPVASSGLDGYPSKTRPLTIDGPADREAPVVVVIPSPGLETEGNILHGIPDASFRVAAQDDASGVSSIRYRWDDDPWIEALSRPIPLPSGTGVHTLRVQAEDHSGKHSELLEFRVDSDGAHPLPPRLIRSENDQDGGRDTSGEPIH